MDINLENKIEKFFNEINDIDYILGSWRTEKGYYRIENLSSGQYTICTILPDNPNNILDIKNMSIAEFNSFIKNYKANGFSKRGDIVGVDRLVQFFCNYIYLRGDKIGENKKQPIKEESIEEQTNIMKKVICIQNKK